MRAAIIQRIGRTTLLVAVLFFSSGPMGFRMGTSSFADDLEALIRRIEDAKSPREVLGLGPNESDEDAVKKAFRHLLHQIHPDKVTERPELQTRAGQATEKLLDSKDALLDGKLANWNRNWNGSGNGQTGSRQAGAKAKPGPRPKPAEGRQPRSRASAHSSSAHHANKSRECSEFYARFVIRGGIPLAGASAATTWAIHREEASELRQSPASAPLGPKGEPAAVAFPLFLPPPPSPSPLPEPPAPEVRDGASEFCSRFNLPDFRARCEIYAAGRSAEELEFCGDFQIPAFQEACFTDLSRRHGATLEAMKSCRRFILPAPRTECLDRMERGDRK